MSGNYTICVGTIGSGLWTSHDGGESWRRVMKDLWSESQVFSLTVHPREPRTVFAGANDGIYKSGDGGQSFNRLESPMDKLHVWKVAVDPIDPDILFAGTRPAALFRSKDGGRSWKKLPAEMAEDCPNVRIPRVTALSVDPTDHRVVWAGIEVDGVRRSTDGGDSWQTITSGIPNPDIHDIGVVVNGGARVLTTTPHEIFESHDRGESWHGLGIRDQFHLRYCRSLSQKADDSETLFVATGDGAAGITGAIQRSKDGGKSWQALELPAVPNSPIWAFATHAADAGRIVACSHYGELYMTENAGDSWTKLPREFTEIRSVAWLPN